MLECFRMRPFKGICGGTKLTAHEKPIFGLLETFGDQYRLRDWIYSEKMLVEKIVKIGTKEKSVIALIGLWSGMRNDVSSLKYLFDITARDRTSPCVGFK